MNDSPVEKNNLHAVRKSIGMVFQDPDDQLFMPTVFEDIAFGPLNYGVSSDDINRCVENALELVGASHLRDKPPYKLSGGEKRRVAIASTLALEPEVLVMDEPTSNLDQRSRRQLMYNLKKRTDTKIIATHDLDMCLELCNRILIISDGEIVRDGTVADVLSDQELLEKYGLELPLQMQGCPVCSAMVN